MTTPRGLFQEQGSGAEDAILLAIARRVARIAPESAGARELGLLTRALDPERDYPRLEPDIRAGFARVCAALGVGPEDTDWSHDGSAEGLANAFFWCVLRWALAGDILDAEVAVEGAEELLATTTSAEVASSELCALIRDSGGAGEAP